MRSAGGRGWWDIPRWQLRPDAGLRPAPPCGGRPVGQQEIHEREASGGGHGRCLYCRLTSFSRSLQINLRINLDGTSFPAYRLSFFPRAQPVVASLYKTTEDRREQMPVLCCIAYQEFPICAGYPCALNSTIFCRKCSIFPFQSLSQGPHLRCDNRRDLFGRDLVQQ